MRTQQIESPPSPEQRAVLNTTPSWTVSPSFFAVTTVRVSPERMIRTSSTERTQPLSFDMTFLSSAATTASRPLAPGGASPSQ